jgi:fatty acid desaturase
VHILISSAAIHLAFTVWHEAAHKNVSRTGWLNNVVGVVGMLPYMTPFFMQKWIHLQHHKRLNEPDDPNLIYTDGPFRTIFLRYPRALGYAKKLISEDPRTRGERLSDLAFLGVVGALYAAALWFGVLLDVILLWFVPVIVAKVMMDWYINYLPHVGLPPHRFLGTRIVDVAWLTPLILLHNYHAIHHLWPYVPWHRYRSIFRDKIEYLRENGVPIEHAVLGDRRPRAALDPQDTLSG